jgi:hypothetical protein
MSSNGLPCVLYKLILSYINPWPLWRQSHPYKFPLVNHYDKYSLRYTRPLPIHIQKEVELYRALIQNEELYKRLINRRRDLLPRGLGKTW